MGQNRIVTFAIEDRVYQINKLPPNGGHLFTMKVAHLLGISLAGEAGAFMAMAQEAGITEEGSEVGKLIAAKGLEGKLLSMVVRLIPHLDPKKLAELMDEVFTSCKPMVSVANGPTVHISLNQSFDEHFGDDRYAGDMFPVAVWAIKENCGGFFVQSGPGFRTLVRHLTQQTSPQTDTGTTSLVGLQRPGSAGRTS